MSFSRNLARARSHIIFVLGLLAATAIIVPLELADLPGDEASDYQWVAARPLSAADREAAAYAWRVLQKDPDLAKRQRGMAEGLGATWADAPAPAELSPEAASVILETLARRHAKAAGR
ncbi:hypothetical protein IC614_11825 [Allosphingosinicella flava]|uniref:Uncharacterized protein n=1 Tax=Allosphingosinicella flava TaxID=2771430 RepID=A0A7T2GJG7_9SPHN|nr:hypothetical protein [Sphingosinicella flava]QPQ54980.1 hypothetical protein IC614_11825 [Sphingosinicella flava]